MQPSLRCLPCVPSSVTRHICYPAPAAPAASRSETSRSRRSSSSARIAWSAGRANLDANLLSAVLTTHALGGRLAAGGSVISIGTIGAERGGGSYGAAKAGLAACNAYLSADVGPRGVTANVISAGYIEGTNFFRDRMTPQRRELLIAATHDKRAGHADDIAQTAHFLASPGARHITGQTIHVNGGAFTTR
jgi:3-oxoacyl-[acyl-carrier protein] reductase